MGSGHAICRVIEVAAVAGTWQSVGYAHALDFGLAGNNKAANIAAGTWHIELFVASPEHRGRGIGAVAVAMIRDELFATTLALAAVAYVAIGNEKAVRAYEQAGFRWQTISRDATRGPEWLMLATRNGQ